MIGKIRDASSAAINSLPAQTGKSTGIVNSPIVTEDLLKSISATEGSKSVAAILNFLSQPVDPKNYTQALGITEDQAHIFYDNFWNSSRIDRESFFEKLIEKHGSKKKFFEANNGVIKSLLDRFFPNDPKIKAIGQHDAQFIITHVHTNALAASLISGLLQALRNDSLNANRSKDTHIRFGHKLCDFLIEIGGTKLAQALHSFNDTKAQWKEGLEKSKYDADRLSEGEFKELAEKLMKASGHDDLWKNMTIGEFMGSGTYLDTREITLNQDYKCQKSEYAKTTADQKFVLQLVKPHTIKRSREIFNLVISLIENAQKVNSGDLGGTIPMSVLLPIMEHYKAMLPEETNLNLAKKKAQIAEALYSGVKVLSNDIKNTEVRTQFYAAGMYENDEMFRVSRRVEGEHFDDFAKTYRETNPALVREVAKAIFLIEMYFILSGKPFDHDRHGHNQGVTVVPSKEGSKTIYTVVVGNFDENGIANQAPSDKEKVLFANIIMDSIANAVTNGMDIRPSIKRIFGILQNKKLQGISKSEYANINAFIKALLSLTDYTKYMDPVGITDFRHARESYLRIVKAIVDTGDIDPVMKDVIAKRYKSIRLFAGMDKPKDTTDDQVIQTESQRHQDFYPKPATKSMWGRPMSVAMRFVVNRAATALKSEPTNYQFIKPSGYDKRLSQLAS